MYHCSLDDGSFHVIRLLSVWYSTVNTMNRGPYYSMKHIPYALTYRFVLRRLRSPKNLSRVKLFSSFWVEKLTETISFEPTFSKLLSDFVYFILNSTKQRMYFVIFIISKRIINFASQKPPNLTNLLYLFKRKWNCKVYILLLHNQLH